MLLLELSSKVRNKSPFSKIYSLLLRTNQWLNTSTSLSFVIALLVLSLNKQTLSLMFASTMNFLNIEILFLVKKQQTLIVKWKEAVLC